MTSLSIDERSVQTMASNALDAIINSNTPTVLFWDSRLNRLRTVSLNANRAKKVLAEPTCVGVYDFDVQISDIVDDIKALLSLAQTEAA